MTGQQLKNSILQLAVQGKLVPQDPADEPASQLLARIREEKEQLIREKKIKREKNPSQIFRGDDGHFYERVGKNEPVCIDEELPFEIPETWEWVRVGQITILTNGYSFKPSDWNTTGLPIVRIQNLNNDSAPFNYFSGEIDEKYYLHGGELLFAWSGTPGTSFGAHVWSDTPAVLNQHIFKLSFSETAVYKQYYRLALNQRVLQLITSAHGGVGLQHVTKKVFENTLIPLPPLNEQIRIVNKLDTLSNLVMQYGILEDKLSVLNTTFPDQLKKSILQEAIQGKLVPQDPADEPASALLERIRAEKEQLIKDGKIKREKNPSHIFRSEDGHFYECVGKNEPVCIDEELPFEIPETWEWARFDAIATFLNGDRGKNYPHKDEYTTDGIAWINTGHIQKNGSLDISSMNYISPEKFNSLRSGKIQRGDLLYCLRGATFGKTAKIEPFKEGAIASSLMIIRFFDLSLRDYIFYYLRSDFAYQQLHLYNNGSAQPNLAAKDVKKYLIPLPPHAEQQRIVDKIEQLDTYINQLPHI